MRRRATILLLTATALLAVLLTVAPWLALTAPVGAPALVVEGWIPDDRLPDVLRLAQARGVRQVFVTGGERPLARYLHRSDTLVINGAPIAGSWRIQLAGLPGVRWQLLGDTLPLREGSADGRLRTEEVSVGPGMRQLRLVSRAAVAPGDTTALLFVQTLQLEGEGLAATGHAVRVHGPHGARTTCALTWAEERAQRLVALGMPEAQVLAVPGLPDARGRTVSAAQAMAAQARWLGLGAYDVVSLSVHARRTRHAHARANGDAVLVGVIALSDPRVPPRTWWLRPAAWPLVAKEVAGLLRDAVAGTFGT